MQIAFYFRNVRMLIGSILVTLVAGWLTKEICVIPS